MVRNGLAKQRECLNVNFLIFSNFCLFDSINKLDYSGKSQRDSRSFIKFGSESFKDLHSSAKLTP